MEFNLKKKSLFDIFLATENINFLVSNVSTQCVVPDGL